MTHVLTVVGENGTAGAVPEVAEAMARIMGADVRALRAHAGTDTTAAVVLRALASPAVILGVLARDMSPEGTVWRVIAGCGKPVVLVPPGGARPFAGISRVLLPLDGTPESAAAVAETVAVLTGAGVELIALHVFDRGTVPAFWDQAAHARDSWQEEFLSRFCPQPATRLRLRSGAPGDSVVDIAAAERADLITLAWSQRLEPGRARTVRHTVARSPVPLMLVPMPAG